MDYHERSNTLIDPPESDLWLYLIVWIAAPVLLFAIFSRGGRLAGFVLSTYLLALIMAHWFGALVHAEPWSTFIESADTAVGFRYTTFGLLALLAGALVLDALRPLRRQPFLSPTAKRRRYLELERIAFWLLLPVGATCWIASSTSASSLPSAGAILSTGKQCLILALCCLCWCAWHLGNRGRFLAWLGASAALPVVTVVTSGFIGYGIVMTTTILSFIAMFYRPRWRLAVALVIALYGGISLWVTNAPHRTEIRSSVWGGESNSASLSKLWMVMTHFEFFDITNESHRQLVDVRLNQNFLVGAAIRVTPALVPFRDGETIYAAAASVNPRALWPDKPAVGGSADYVSQHTLIAYSAGTSVGMGQALEFYINFGLAGVIVGFALLGAALRYADIRLAEALAGCNWPALVTVFLLGSSMLQPGGALAEIAAAFAAAWVFSLGLALLTKRFTPPRPQLAMPSRQPPHPIGK